MKAAYDTMASWIQALPLPGQKALLGAVLFLALYLVILPVGRWGLALLLDGAAYALKGGEIAAEIAVDVTMAGQPAPARAVVRKPARRLSVWLGRRLRRMARKLRRHGKRHGMSLMRAAFFYGLLVIVVSLPQLLPQLFG